MSTHYVIGFPSIVLLLCVDLALAYAPVPLADEEREVQLPKPLQHEKCTHRIRLLAYSPKLHLLAATPGIYYFGRDGTPALPIYVWDLSSGQCKNILVGHSQQITDLAFLPESDKLLSGASDGIVLWDPLAGTENRKRFGALSASATLTPSGKELFCWDGKRNGKPDVIIWDAADGKEKRLLKTTDEMRKGIEALSALSCVMSPDEHYLVLGAGLMNRRIIVWDYQSGKVTATLNHETELRSLCFSSHYLFAGGCEMRKGTWGRAVLHIWDTAAWKLIREIEVDEYELTPVLYIPKYDLVLSVDLVHDGEPVRYKTLINGYSIKTGEKLISYDTNLPKTGFCNVTIYLKDLNAICIGGNDGKISFFSVAEVLKQKKQPVHAP
jgi:WD40 repeat protein